MHRFESILYKGTTYVRVAQEPAQQAVQEDTTLYAKLPEGARSLVDTRLEKDENVKKLLTELSPLIQQQSSILQSIQSDPKQFETGKEQLGELRKQVLTRKNQIDQISETIAKQVYDTIQQGKQQETQVNEAGTKQPSGSESPDATLYPVPLKMQHRGNAAAGSVPMDVEEVKMEKAPKAEKSEKGNYKEDKGWEKEVEKNTGLVADQGSEEKQKKTAKAPDYVTYRGKRYARVNK